jgi:hypothetical protein
LCSHSDRDCLGPVAMSDQPQTHLTFEKHNSLVGIFIAKEGL